MDSVIVANRNDIAAHGYSPAGEFLVFAPVALAEAPQYRCDWLLVFCKAHNFLLKICFRAAVACAALRKRIARIGAVGVWRRGAATLLRLTFDSLGNGQKEDYGLIWFCRG